MENSMFRFLAAMLAIGGLTAAAPAHRQPTPASLPVKAAVPDPSSAEAKKREDARERNGREHVARDKAWDAKTKRTMNGVCRGC